MLSEEDIDICRSTFGPPGNRKFSFLERELYLKIKRPDWCDESDMLNFLFQNKWKLIHHGHIVWGHIVQANNLLFRPGKDDCPASVIFSPDPNHNPTFRALESTADLMYKLKGTKPDDVELRKIADTLANEIDRTFGVIVPKTISHGFNLLEASTFISRKHLPNKVLRGRLFPLLISKTSPYFCIPLPSKYWPQSLAKSWCDS